MNHEAGNYYPPTPDDEIPLTPWESIAIYAFILFFSLISLACIATGPSINTFLIEKHHE